MKAISTFLFSILLLFPFWTLTQSTVTQVYTSTGSLTIPCGTTSFTVHVIGGGGGGGGCNTNNVVGGGGGGGGGYVSWSWNVFAGGTFEVGDVVNFTVGAGGAVGTGAAPAANGGPGGSSYFYDPLGTLLLFANGGLGGEHENTGGIGSPGGTASPWAGGVTGTSGSNATLLIGGLGGAANGFYGGGGGPGGGAGAPGGNGGNYGGGGGGGGPKNGPSTPNGGAGGSGAIIVVFNLNVNYPNAGPNQSTCNVLQLSANSPSPGYTGTWSVVSNTDPGNPPVISNINDPNATVTITNPGNCVTLRWTFTSPGCTPLFDDVVVCYPLLCNDDPCGAIPLPVTVGGCAYTTYSNNGATASIGMVEPGCGSYSNNDAWYSAVVPANGILSVQATDAAGGTSMIMGITIYDGINCNEIYHAGCDAATSSADMAQITFVGTPGETVYIRVWDINEAEANFQICAWTPSVGAGQIEGENNTVVCGSSYLFMDPGGSGNYQNNTGANYILCPSVPGQYVTVNFSGGANFFNVENGYDLLTILDGASDSSIAIGQYTGVQNPGVVTSSAADGCLTVIFQSDYTVTGAGWQAVVSCTATAGVNDSLLCSPTDCLGECGTWVCNDGLYPTSNLGNQVEDIAIQTSGCFEPFPGEIASQWFYFTALTAGSIEFTFNGPNGQDYDFAVWGPNSNDEPPCPQTTGLAPIRCSSADVSNTANPVGLSQVLGGGQAYEGNEGNGWIDALYVTPGQTYALLMNIYMNGNPQPIIDMTIGGSGTLDCTPVILPIELLSFNGINQGGHNLITWMTKTEINNDYFTLERSVNGFDWEVVGTKDGAGNSQGSRYYEMRDYNFYVPVTYYRLRQTDFNGVGKYFKVISVNADREVEGGLVTDIFPNPATDYATFVFAGTTLDLPLKVEVINEMGAVIVSNTYMNLYEGMPSTLRTDALSNGMYQVVFTQGDRREVKKLSIIK